MAAKKMTNPQLQMLSQQRAVADARPAQALANEATTRSLTELLHELQAHQIELEMENEAMREALELHKFILDGVKDPLFVKGEDHKLLIVNRAFCDVFGLNPEAVIGQTLADRVTAIERENFLAVDRTVLESGLTNICEESLTVGDSTRIIITTKACIVSPAGSKLLVGSIHDITERKKLELQIREMAFYDPLTQLPNRRLLGDRFIHCLAESKRSNQYGALIFLDLDNFKALNDNHGHAVGDMLLVQAAQRMRGCVREIDTVARLGGDEFVVMMVDLNENKAAATAQAGSLAEKIRAALAEPYRLAVKSNMQAGTLVEHCCTVSMGVVVFIEREGTQDDFMRLADTAMYHAKGAGSNVVRFAEAVSRS